MDRIDGRNDALHGTVIDYLYPILGHGGLLDAETLQRYAPRSNAKARDDLRTLTRHGYLEPLPADYVHPLETRGFDRVGTRTGEPVATDPVTYTLGPAGERYVEERDLTALEPSLAYVFGD